MNKNLFLKLVYLSKYFGKFSNIHGILEAVNIMFSKPAHHQHSPSADEILSSETVSTHVHAHSSTSIRNPNQTPNLFSEW